MTGSQITGQASTGGRHRALPGGRSHPGGRDGARSSSASVAGGTGRANLLAPVTSTGQRLAGSPSGAVGPAGTRSASRDDLSSWRYVLDYPILESTSPGGGITLTGQVLPYPPRKAAKLYPDFYPWRHTKEDDTTATECVQQGYFEPSKVTNEGGSARNTMLPLIKQWTSLPALSFFLANAMEMRDRCCRINTTSTFKPPPRVTLTDQKRESWLRDLASPHVPLRKLARTIPHGIRNRGLLEQCCNKLIPIPRAVWFARCVGANELRGLRRKGGAITASTALSSSQGGGAAAQQSGISEAAWVQEWTQELLVFIEKVAGEHGGPMPTANSGVSPDLSRLKSSTVAGSAGGANGELVSWSTRMEYVARLVAYLFNEGLVNHSVFLQWVVTYVQLGPIPHVPVALMFVRTFWNFLVDSRALSRALAIALLRAYCKVEPAALIDKDRTVAAVTMDKRPLATIAETLRSCIRRLFATNSDSFIMTREWKELGPVLVDAVRGQSAGQAMETSTLKRLDSIRLTNEAMVASDSPRARLMRNPKHALVAYLDSLHAPFDIGAIADRLHSLGAWDLAVTVLLEWATTNSRAGPWRLYLCLEVCSVIASRNIDVLSALLSFLTSLSSTRSYNMCHVHLLVSEFAQKDDRLVGAYFRRLISTSVLFAENLQSTPKAQLEIIENIPGFTLPHTLRSQMAGYMREKLEASERLGKALKESLNFLFDSGSENYRLLTPDERELFACADLSTKLNHVDIIVDAYESMIGAGYVSSFQAFDRLLTNSSFMPSQSHLAVIFDYLECAGDMRAVYHIVWTTIDRAQSSTLFYFLAMYIKGHLECFLVMGHFEDLIQMLVKGYNRMKVKTKMTQEFSGLIQFALSKLTNLDPLIKAELEILLRPITQPSPMYISTLSPMSETMIGAPEAVNAEAEQVLATIGINLSEIDGSTYAKFLIATIEKLAQLCSGTGDAEATRTAAMALYYLKDLDTNNSFEDLVSGWLRDQLLEGKAGQLSRTLAVAIIYDSISLEKVYQIFSQLKADNVAADLSSSRHMILSLVFVSQGRKNLGSQNIFELKPSELLMFELHQNSFQISSTEQCLSLVLDELLLDQEVSPCAYEAILKFLSQVLGSNFELFHSAVVEPILESNAISVISRFMLLLDDILRISGPTNYTNIECSTLKLKDELATLIDICDEFSVCLCQTRLEVLLKLVQLSEQAGSLSEFRKRFAADVIRCTEDAFNKRTPKNVVGDLVVCLDSGWKSEILYQAESCALDTRWISPGSSGIIGYYAELIDAVADSTAREFLSERSQQVRKFLLDLIKLTNEYSIDDDTSRNEMRTKFESDIRDATQLLIKVVMIDAHSDVGGQPCDEIVSGLSALGEYFASIQSHEIATLIIDTINSIYGAQAGNQTQSHQSLITGHGQDVSPFSGWYSSESYMTNLVSFARQNDMFQDLRISPFDLLEDGNPTISVNDVPIDLTNFDCTIDQRNPV